MGVVETVRDIAVLVQKADNIQLNQKILELQAELSALLDENRRLTDRVQEMERQKTAEGELVFEDNLYWRESDGDRVGPYCTKCWDVDGKLVRIQESEDSLWCPSCEDYPMGHYNPSIA